MKFSSLSLILSLTILASCGGGGGGGKSSSEQSPYSGPANAKVLEFKGSCNYNSELQKYVKTVLLVTLNGEDEDVLLRDDFYNDARCSQGVLLSLEMPLTETEDTGEITFAGKTNGLYYRPRAKEIARNMNQQAACGKTDWAVNTAVSVTECLGFENLSVYADMSEDEREVAVFLCEKGANSPDKCKQLLLKK